MKSEPTAVLDPGSDLGQNGLIGVGSPSNYQIPKTNSFGGSRIVQASGKGERASPGQADCDPSVAESQLTLVPYVTLVQKPRMPLLASSCLLLLMEDAPLGR